MFSLVAGAGYNVVVPSAAAADDSGSSGGSGSTVATPAANTTVNETVNGTSDDDGDDDDGVISGGIDKIGDFVKNMGWKSVVIVLVSLAVVGGAVWYFLKDKRKKFIEVRTKKK